MSSAAPLPSSGVTCCHRYYRSVRLPAAIWAFLASSACSAYSHPAILDTRLLVRLYLGRISAYLFLHHFRNALYKSFQTRSAATDPKATDKLFLLKSQLPPPLSSQLLDTSRAWTPGTPPPLRFRHYLDTFLALPPPPLPKSTRWRPYRRNHLSHQRRGWLYTQLSQSVSSKIPMDTGLGSRIINSIGQVVAEEQN